MVIIPSPDSASSVLLFQGGLSQVTWFWMSIISVWLERPMRGEFTADFPLLFRRRVHSEHPIIECTLIGVTCTQDDVFQFQGLWSCDLLIWILSVSFWFNSEFNRTEGQITDRWRIILYLWRWEHEPVWSFFLLLKFLVWHLKHQTGTGNQFYRWFFFVIV